MQRENDLARNSKLVERLFVVLTLVAVCLVTSFSNPGFLDLPNHLARFYVMTRDFKSPFFNSVYETNFRLLPNVGVDVLMFGLGRLIDPGIALRMILGAIVALQCFGFLRLHRSFQKEAASPLILLLPMTVISYSFVLGFLNFSLALALLPWALSSIMRARTQAWWISLIAWSTVLFFCHFFAWLIFAYLTLIWFLFGSGAKPQVKEVIGVVFVLAVYVALYKLSPSSNEESRIIWSSATDKFKFFFATFVFGPFWKPASAMFFSLIGALAVLRKIDVNRGAVTVLIATGVLFAICPMGLSIGGNFDARIPAIFFALLISLSSIRLTAQLRKATLVVSFLITLLHFVACGAAMNQSNVEAARARSILRIIPQNSVVTVLSLNFDQSTHRDTWYPNYNMLQFVGVPEKPMHVQGLFSYPTQQPVLVKRNLQQALPIPMREKSGNVETRQADYKIWRENIAQRLVPLGFKKVYVFIVDHRSTSAKLEISDEILFQDASYKLIVCDLSKG